MQIFGEIPFVTPQFFFNIYINIVFLFADDICICFFAKCTCPEIIRYYCYCCYVSIVVIVEDVLLVELMYLVFTRIPSESYRRRLRSLLYLCCVFRALINSLVC